MGTIKLRTALLLIAVGFCSSQSYSRESVVCTPATPQLVLRRLMVKQGGLCDLFSPVCDLNRAVFERLAGVVEPTSECAIDIARSEVLNSLIRERNKICFSEKPLPRESRAWHFLWITNAGSIPVELVNLQLGVEAIEDNLMHTLSEGASLLVPLRRLELDQNDLDSTGTWFARTLRSSRITLRVGSDSTSLAYDLALFRWEDDLHWPARDSTSTVHPLWYEPPVPTNVQVRFPWPPPAASTQTSIGREALVPSTGTPSIRDVNLTLVSALSKCGYDEIRYFAVPDGFALVTRLEQIQADGSPDIPKRRWSKDVSVGSGFSLVEIVKSLFRCEQGYFRILVFIVTPHSFSQADTGVSAYDAEKWLHIGLNKLPPEIGRQPYTKQHDCTVLVYEFVKHTYENEAGLEVQGRLSARVHLEKSGLARSLNSQ